MDDQQLLVVAAEAAHPLVDEDMPARLIHRRADHSVGILVEADGVGAPEQPPYGHPASGEVGQPPAQLDPAAVEADSRIHAPPGQIDPIGRRRAAQRLVEAVEVVGSIDARIKAVPECPGLAVLMRIVDRGRRIAALRGREEPAAGSVTGSARSWTAAPDDRFIGGQCADGATVAR
ncbi:MAG: hypothetical protein ACJ782_13785 [Actinomycetota bacterium]